MAYVSRPFTVISSSLRTNVDLYGYSKKCYSAICITHQTAVMSIMVTSQNAGHA